MGRNENPGRKAAAGAPVKQCHSDGPDGDPRRPVSDLQRADTRLLQILDSGLREGMERAGAWMECRPGCTECCIGPFPITRLDAWRLRRGLEALERRDPVRAEALRRRAREAVRRLSPEFRGDARGLLNGDDPAGDPLFDRYSALPCPVLDPKDGTCELYEFRPVICRSFGLPIRVDGEDLPPCRLCFVGAPPEDAERCRVEPDPTGIEDAILEGMAVIDGEERETIIAFALGSDDEGSTDR